LLTSASSFIFRARQIYVTVTMSPATHGATVVGGAFVFAPGWSSAH
jgi:hypothetical protein